MKTRLIAWAIVALSIVYLSFFIPRGWIPHDEGMIGQSAERVLHGEVPHVDYEEPYTGGLALVHALVFKVAGIDLLYPRWLLFAGAILAQVLTYLILTRYVQPIGAALCSWLALSWSFPNYFAALPSWWLLICALAVLWAFIRFVETGLLRYAAAAGLAAGLSILIKQTGLYVLAALVIALLYDGEEHNALVWWPGRVICASAAVAALGLAFMILSARLTLSDLIYLFLPIVACSRVLVATDGRQLPHRQWEWLLAPAIGVAAAAVPLVAYVAPYIINHQLAPLVNGLVVLPQKRVQFASLELPPAHWILAGLPLAAIVMPLPGRVRVPMSDSRAFAFAMWILGALLVAGSLYSFTPYQMIWQSARSFGAILPLAICSLLLTGYVRDRLQRRVLFGCASLLAWASLVQVPFSAPIYYCYVTPLAVIAAVAVAGTTHVAGRTLAHVSVAALLVFGVVSMNRGDVYNLGGLHRPAALDEPLGLRRASLNVRRADAVTYRRVIDLIAKHIGDGQLAAGPDAPEVYFLTGRFSRSGTLFDFFTDGVSAEGGLYDLPGLDTASVVVLNHGRRFSQGPSAHLANKARHMFPNFEAVGTFEVRWR
jgi:hypothetical protein